MKIKWKSLPVLVKVYQQQTKKPPTYQATTIRKVLIINNYVLSLCDYTMVFYPAIKYYPKSRFFLLNPHSPSIFQLLRLFSFFLPIIHSFVGILALSKVTRIY